MNTPIIGDLIQTVGNLASDLITTEKEVRQLDLEDYKAETDRLTAQTDINKEEAKSSSLWVSGARPFIMWVCGLAFAYATILEPVLRFSSKVWFDYPGDFPVIDTNLTMQVLFGILGLGVMRSYDKKIGTSS